MKLYRHLAWDGIRKNSRLYVPYLLTGVGAVSFFYILVALSRLPGGNPARQRLRAGDPESGQLCAVGVFSAAAVLHPFLPDPPPEPGVCPV